jgi:hypothetical protein
MLPLLIVYMDAITQLAWLESPQALFSPAVLLLLGTPAGLPVLVHKIRVLVAS